MRVPGSDWDEFDWEQALRESDQFAETYFRLLRRFCDLPGANELIAQHMGPEFQAELMDLDMEGEGVGHGWGGDSTDEPWSDEDTVMGFASEAGDHDRAPVDDDDQGSGINEALFYETDPVFVALRQAAIGWCNIYAAILPQEAREKGLRVLFHVGRCLANLAYSIDDGGFDQPSASISFAKRSLSHLNLAVGLLNELIQEQPRLKRILTTIRGHLVRGNDGLVDHLQRCRSALDSPDDGEEVP